MLPLVKLIGTKRAAEILGVPTRTLRRWAFSGTVRPHTQPDETGAYLFDEAAVIQVRDERIAAQRARLDEIEQSA